MSDGVDTEDFNGRMIMQIDLRPGRITEMIDIDDERNWIHIARIKEDEDWPAKFVIDGRKYPNSKAAHDAVQHAHDELARRRIPAEIESSPASPTEPALKLPSWEQYLAQLIETDRTESR